MTLAKANGLTGVAVDGMGAYLLSKSRIIIDFVITVEIDT